jgi:hypothetical protein
MACTISIELIFITIFHWSSKVTSFWLPGRLPHIRTNLDKSSCGQATCTYGRTPIRAAGQATYATTVDKRYCINLSWTKQVDFGCDDCRCRTNKWLQASCKSEIDIFRFTTGLKYHADRCEIQTQVWSVPAVCDKLFALLELYRLLRQVLLYGGFKYRSRYAKLESTY